MKTRARRVLATLFVALTTGGATALDVVSLTATEAVGGFDVPMAEANDALSPAVFDIDVAPDGSVLVAENATIKRMRGGETSEVARLALPEEVPINGIEALGANDVLVASGGLDLAVGAGVWRVTDGEARLVADIAAFETAVDPDATGGSQWKDPRCEATGEFSAGPQSNPYHLVALAGGGALVADAAGNSLLHTTADGAVDWVAVFTPPVDERGEPHVLFTLEDGTDCYVQPVPTAVDVGPDGAYYVGELTGAPGATGLSRVWRIEPEARNVVCPSDACREVVSGLTSVMDVAFGPEGGLYVVEFDANGWLQATEAGDAAGGTLKRCDVGTGTCDLVEDGLALPGALSFDGQGRAWLLENGIVAPTVRAVDR